MRFLCKSIVLMLTLNILWYLDDVPFKPRGNLFGKEHFYDRRAGIQDQLSTAYAL